MIKIFFIAKHSKFKMVMKKENFYKSIKKKEEILGKKAEDSQQMAHLNKLSYGSL